MAPFRTAVLSLVALLVCSSSALAAREHVIARVHGSVPVLAAPGGAVLTELSSRTAFGSPRVLSVLARSGHWLQVATSDLPAGSEGWCGLSERFT
jgi:hypothetical protein